MKNNLLLPGFTLILLFLMNTNLSAQYYENIEFKKGDVEAQVGVGLMSTFVGKNTNTTILPLSLSVNYRLQKHLSIGAYLGYSQTEYVAPEEDGEKLPGMTPELVNNYFLTGLRFQGHFSRDRFDFYGGGMIGYNFSVNESENLTDGRLQNIRVEDYADAWTWSGYIGAKYLLTKHFGVFGEVGYGASLFTIGINTRF